MAFHIKRLSYDTFLFCLALLLSYVEFLLFPMLPLPGFKLGLCNVVILFIAKNFSVWDAGLVSLLRVICSSVLFGTIPSFWFSLLGALFSWLILFGFAFFKKHPFSVIGVSVLCASAHQCGQILAASLLFQTYALCFTYLPLLLLYSLITGMLTGYFLYGIQRRFPTIYIFHRKGLCI